MIVTYDKNGRVISRCKNLRYALNRARRVPVTRVVITLVEPSMDDMWDVPKANVQISWHDGAYMRANIASFEIVTALFEGKARNDPRRWPKPVFNY
jgi:hypothetical protein